MSVHGKASLISLTDDEYEKLRKLWGDRVLKQRIAELQRQKEDGLKRIDLSDYHSLRSRGMQSVEPIRDKQDIQRMKRLLRRRNMRDYFMFVLGINTGLRVGDLLTLRVLDVRDRTHIVIQEQKRGKTKRFKLNSELQLEIQDYTEDMAAEEYLFPSKKTNLPITREQAYRIIKNAADQLGIDGAGTHTMRKTFGYHLYNQTKDIARLQKIFNHSAPEVTMRYLGITQDELDDLVDDFIL